MQKRERQSDTTISSFPIEYDNLALISNFYLLSFCVMVPFSSFPAMEASTLLASLAKSRSLTSAGETGTMAKASLSSFSADVPIFNYKKKSTTSSSINRKYFLLQKKTSPGPFDGPLWNTPIVHLLLSIYCAKKKVSGIININILLLKDSHNFTAGKNRSPGTEFLLSICANNLLNILLHINANEPSLTRSMTGFSSSLSIGWLVL